jgi:tetratricopeptide (TPR) repeat protein
VRSLEAGLVDIVREFLLAHLLLRRLFARNRVGELRWEEVERLAGDDESSVLFRLKERCHTLFRAGEFGESAGGPPRVALFDLAVGSLFHEAMKLRENFYQLEVYAPKVAAMRAAAEPGTEGLFEEFGKILEAARQRFREALEESEALLEQTRRQFRVLLFAHRESGLLARYLVENAEAAAEVLGESLDDFFAAVHGEAVAGWALAARAYLDSGFFDEAEGALDEALARAPQRPDLERARRYARGMAAYLRGRYDQAVADLDAWAGPSPEPRDAHLTALAHAAVTRLEQLVEGQGRESLLARASALAERLEPQATGG